LRNNLKGVIKRAKSNRAYGEKKARGMKKCLKPPSPPFG